MTETAEIIVIVVAGAVQLLTLRHQVKMDARAEARSLKAESERKAQSETISKIAVQTDGMSEALGVAKHAEGVSDEKVRAAAEAASNAAAVAKDRQEKAP